MPQHHHQYQKTLSMELPSRPAAEMHSNYNSLRTPTEGEVLVAFEDVLKKMDLPPDKIRILRDVDLSKKWELVRNQRQVDTAVAVTSPSEYLEKLLVYIDVKKNAKKKKRTVGGDSSYSLLRHIEISLRTNSIDWVLLFLGPESNGLQILIEYLTLLLESLFCTSADPIATAPIETPSYTTGQSSFFASSGSSHKDGAQQQNFSPNLSATDLHPVNSSGNINIDSSAIVNGNSTFKKKNGSIKKHSAKNVFLLEDDIHVCVSCLRAIMNNKYGLKMVLNNKQAIYCIVCSIVHPSLRTKTLAVDLLSAISTLTDGHCLVVEAFNRFHDEYKEQFRFQTLFRYFRYPSEINVDFMSSCMKFINVLVHSPEDLNQRVSLQYEFATLGLDAYLRELENEFNECDVLMRQMASFAGNFIDVDRLLSVSSQYGDLQRQMEFLEQDYSRQKEEFQMLQAQNYVQISRMNEGLKKLQSEKSDLEYERNNRDITISTLSRDFKLKEQKYANEINELEGRIKILEDAKREIQNGLKVAQQHSASTTKVMVNASSAAKPSSTSISTSAGAPKEASFVDKKPPLLNGGATPMKISATPAPPPPNLPNGTAKFVASSNIPPAPPLPSPRSSVEPSTPKATTSTGGPGPPPPPPPPSLFFKAPPPPPLMLMKKEAMQQQLPNKRIAITKHKLPMLNWSALNPNQVKGTVFNEINDEKLVDVLDLTFLEDFFKINDKNENATTHEDNSSVSSGAGCQNSPRSSATSNTEKTSLLDTKRLQNIAIIRRKLGKSVMDIMSAVHRFDLTGLSQDQVDILMKIIPTPDEVKKYKEYGAQNNGCFDGLTIEDQFLAQLMEIERLQIKLQIMSFMAGFNESFKLLFPNLQKISAASSSLKEAKKFPKIIEVILAVGNAMNGTRRVPVYGFKLSSLDSLNILRSPKDRTITLMSALVEIISTSFPPITDFTSELKFVEAASNVNMETLSADVLDNERKFEQALNEQQRRGKDTSETLNVFIEEARPQIETLREEFKLAQSLFDACAEYYGEVAGRTQPDVLFGKIAAFSKNFTLAMNENEARKRIVQRQADEQKRKGEIQAQNKKSRNAQQDRILDELNAKFLQTLGNGGDKRNGNLGQKKLDSTQINDGDFERIINGLKEGYVVQSLGLSNGGGGGGGAIRRRPSPNRGAGRQEPQLNSAREIQRGSAAI